MLTRAIPLPSDRASKKDSVGAHGVDDRRSSRSGSAGRDYPAFDGAERQPMKAGPGRVPLRDAQREPMADAPQREKIKTSSSRSNSRHDGLGRQDLKDRSSRGTDPGCLPKEISSTLSKRGPGTPNFDGSSRVEIAPKLSGRGTPAFDGPERKEVNSGVSGRGGRSESAKHSTQPPTSVHSSRHPPSTQVEPHSSKRQHPRSQTTRTSEHDLISYRLRQAYGYQISDLEIKHICRMDSKNGEEEVEPAGMKHNWIAESKGVTKNVILGRDVKAVSGQVVRHVGGGKRPPGQFDGDYLSGGETGTVTDVSGDYAQVRWSNGNVRFYYVGATPWRKDPNGKNTDNPRAVRCLVLVQT